jgi:hypothetical protein
MHWSDLERDQPRLAKLAHDRLIRPGVVLVATVRRDGTPRLSPVEPLIMDGDLWLSMMWHSAKALDLLRDPRILVHNIIASRSGTSGELKIRGAAIHHDDPSGQRRYADTAASTLGWDPEPGKFHLFAVDIRHAAFISYDEPTGDQHVATWPPAKEFIRRATSATSVGDPEPVTETERLLKIG